MSTTYTIEVDAQIAMPAGYQPEHIRSLVDAALRAESATGSWLVTVVFTNDDQMQELHRDFLDDDTPTDIMTFPYSDAASEWVGNQTEDQGGDIVISVDRAREQAEQGNWDVWQELQFLVIHGVLHLCGWDDSSNELRAAMHSRQHHILQQFQET